MAKNKTPVQSVKKFCKDCCGSIYKTKNCGGEKLLCFEDPCPLYPYREGKGRVSVKTIRKHCLLCMGGSKVAVRECPSEKCSLYPFRLGTNPNYGKKNRKQKSKAAKKFNLSALGLLAKKKKK